ncbi:MAG: hypothetical protein H8E34_07085 [Bacteroidetes bacterium]|nr:hypothetical protein [Bacteroidota bacterium]MBL6944599.1 hypothetical protein [Bacteroidales bacterium]
MKRVTHIILSIMFLYFGGSLLAQNDLGFRENTASKLMYSDKKFTIGGYGQIDYNQPFGDNKIQNGNLDVHRIILMVGYRFNSKFNFITEFEIEHVTEFYIEQAFLNYTVNTYIQIRGGLMLVPMGIINEYHEPPTFNSVERPLIDKYISPTTWREIGAGITGTIPELSIRYQSYLMNGFSSFNGRPLLSGSDGLRNGRQKGAKSIIRTPVLASRIEYFGVLGLNLGLSAYLGNTQSSLFKDLDKEDNNELITADSSVVKVNMFGFDAHYQKRGIQLSVQTYYATLSNTLQYNYFTSSDNVANDVGSSIYGYYVEAGYNVFQEVNKLKSELIAFVRYSAFNTQNTVEEGILKNTAYNRQVITAGINWKPLSELALKADFQLHKSEQDDVFSKVFNAGIAIWL